MRITSRLVTRIVTLAAAVTVAAGLAVAVAVPAFAATAPSTFVLGPQVKHAGCEVALFSARVSSSTPAEVFASVDSANPGHKCVGFVERSVTKKTSWATASAKVTLPSVRGLQGSTNTGLVYDGPGYKARGCVWPVGSAKVYCTSARSLAKGSGTATSPALAPVYERKLAQLLRPITKSKIGICVGGLESSTTTKKAGATVVGILLSATDACTAWVQSSPDGGKTWTTVSPVVSATGPKYPGEAAVFTAHYADNPGYLARICAKDLTSKKENCSGSW